MDRVERRAELDRRLAWVSEHFAGDLAFAARNLATGETVLVDADRVYPTASAIKLAILVELFRQVSEDGLDFQRRLELTDADIVRGSGILKELGPGLRPTVQDLATLMVVLSDNTATNMLIDLVGGVAAVNRTIHERFGLTTIVLHNRVDFERIGGEVRRFGEATAAELMRLVELLLRGEVVDEQASRAMLEIMGRQQYLDQVPRYLNFSPYAGELKLEQSIWVGCKTGFFPGTRVDAGAIRLPEDVAIAYCAMTHNGADTSIAAETEGAVTNGILGRLILDYWWPGDTLPATATLPSPYVDRVLSGG